MVSPGRHWFPAEPTGPFLRLSYVGAGAGDLVRGVEILADVLGRPGGRNAGPPNRGFAEPRRLGCVERPLF